MASTLLSSEPAAAELPTPRGSSCESADRRGGRRPKPRNRLALQNHCYGNSPLLSPLTQTVWGLNAPQRPGRNVRASTASFRIGETDADTRSRHSADTERRNPMFVKILRSPERARARATDFLRGLASAVILRAGWTGEVSVSRMDLQRTMGGIQNS